MRLRMGRTAAAFLLVMTTWAAAAQPTVTVHWGSAVTPAGDDNTFEITFTGKILDGWHTYDLHSDFSSTVVTFEKAEGVELVGEPFEKVASKRYYDEIFGFELGEYEGEIVLGQRVRLTVPEAVLRGNINWRSCQGTNCNMPEDWPFEIRLGGAAETSSAGTPATTDTVTSDSTTDAAHSTPLGETSSGGDLPGLILVAIGWGLLALLTPCVFPMIPMTVSFFLKGSESPAAGRFKALMYGLFIVLLYTVPIAAIILVTRIVGGDAVTADIFNWLATHWLPNLIFFLVFMVFAASFFGAFEITLPGSMVNRSDRNADRGGLPGVFFMALTLVLVSFSCTGPIVGSAIIGATSGAFWAPILTMLVFSITFALPFTLFAMFPSLLKNLPRSGGWLNSVKVVLGFIEVALGFKFLSVADQTYHWGLLDREVYLAVWIVCFTLLGFYLLGKLRFAHDSEVKTLSVTRLALAIVDFTFVVYMIPGMWGAPLKALSGYLPPLHTQDFILGQTSAAADAVTESASAAPSVKYDDILTMPHGIAGYFEWNEALAASRAAGKPLFIDVTGHGCVNCREMEQKVLSDARVQQLLRDDYIVVALYTDDKARAAEEDWITTESGATLKEIGRINSYIVRTRFNVNAQPTYIVADAEGVALLPPREYDLSVGGFITFLEEGVAAYRRTE